MRGNTRGGVFLILTIIGNGIYSMLYNDEKDVPEVIERIHDARRNGLIPVVERCRA